MNVQQLVDQYRLMARDRARPPFVSDAEVIGWLAEAEAEAAIRGRLLHESVNPEVCSMAVTLGTSVYPLHPALYEIDYLAFQRAGDRRRRPVELISAEDLTRLRPDWREAEGDVRWAVQGDTSLRLAFTPGLSGTLFLEGYRLPLVPLDQAQGALVGIEPEINAAHHRFLVYWVLYRAFSVPDSDLFSPEQAVKSLETFSSYFGARPDVDLRRKTREDQPHHTEAIWP